MKTICSLLLILVAGVAMAAEENESANGPLTLPTEATRTGPGAWQYTDAEGKVWNYTKTPFGLTRYEAKATDEGETGDRENQAAPLIKAHDEGDQVRFERQVPFGVFRWTRKKSEHNDEERKAWERATRDQPAESAETTEQE